MLRLPLPLIAILIGLAVHRADANEPSTANRDPALWPFTSDSPWNRPIGSAARYADIESPGMSVQSGASLNANRWSHPVYLARDSDPIRRVYLRDDSAAFATSSSAIATIHIPADAEPDAMADGHLHIIDPQRRWVMELFEADVSQPGKILATSAVHNSLRGPGVYESWHGVRAYGGSAIGGLIRQDELTHGIRHAVAVAVKRSALNKHGPGGRPFVWPACQADDGWEETYATRGNLHMGTLLAIPANVDLARTSLPLQSPPYQLALALQNYGAYITDVADANLVFYAEPAAADEIPTNFDRHLAAIIPLLRVVTNNSRATVGGGGTPRVPLAPRLDRVSR